MVQERGGPRGLEGFIERSEGYVLGLAGLAVLSYLAELMGVWSHMGLKKVYEAVALSLDLIFVADLVLKVAVQRGRYLRGPWFVIDLISALPVLSSLAILPAAGQGLYFVRGFRLFRILRTLRALRVLRTLKVFKFVKQGAQITPETRAFNRALVISVVIYTVLFMVLVTGLYAGVADEAAGAMQRAREVEFYLVVGSLMGMLLVMVVVRFQIPEIAAQQVRSLLNVALPEQVAEHFMKHPESYDRTVRAPATVIFCDIKGFTSTVERLGGDLVTLKHHLERAMDVVTAVHRRYDLIIDKFIGDAIMSFRGGDLVSGGAPEHAWRVVRATLDGIQALEDLDDPYFKEMKIGGASSEVALIGAFGTSSRLSYTILGDRVNLAARLEGAVSQCGTRNLFCALTVELTRDRQDIVWRRFGRLRVQGKSEALDIYEAFAPERLGDRAWIDLYHAALDAFEGSRFEEARAGFEGVDAARPEGDPPSRRYIERCARLIEQGSPAGWEPVFQTEK